MLARTSAAFAVLLLTACPGGHKDTTSRLGGVVRLASGEVSDGDVADPNAPYHPNDTPETAQAVATGARIGGWVGAGMDELDWYRVTLGASQKVIFTVVEAAANGGISACLFAASDTTAPPVDCVSPSGAADVLTAPAAGEYLVRIEAVTGASSYQLRIGAATAVAIGPPALHLSAEFVPGEVLVRFREPAGRSAAAPGQVARAAAADLGLELTHGAEGGPAVLRARGGAERAIALRRLGVEPLAVEPGGASLDPVVDAKRETLRMVAGLRARADVASADPNYVFHPTYVPSDPDAYCTPEATSPPCHHFQQWHYDLIGAQQAWNLEPTRGAGVIVAVIDTGVFTTHPDLVGQLTAGYDFVSDPVAARDGNGIDPDPSDPGDDARPGQSSYHGTHVTGTIAAAANNGLGGAGIAFGAKVMPVRALGVGGGTSIDIIQAVRYAAGRTNASGTVPPRRADIANLSFGCTGCYSATEEAEYQAARDAGVILVAASGNDGAAVDGYPAAYASVVSVGAATSATTADPAQALASYSNTGPTVALVAPGGDATDRDHDGKPDMVFSTWVDDRTPGTQKPVYAFMAGTSMAAPHVSGVVALMKAKCPTLGPDQLRYLLRAGRMTDRLGASPRNDTFGYGLVDAAKGVAAAFDECGKPVPPSLTAAAPRFAFAPLQSSKTVTVATSGGDPGVILSVTGIDPGAPWLTVAAEAIDANGLGTYRLTVDRAHPALAADGTYAATALFSASSGTVLAVPVSVTVGPTAAGPGGGFAYVLLFTCDALGRPVKAQGEDKGTASGGGFRYEFPLLSTGRYCVVAGTDDDNDGSICGEGEACSILDPGNASTLGAFVLTGNQLDHDLTLTYQVTATPASAAIPIPASTFRRVVAGGR